MAVSLCAGVALTLMLAGGSALGASEWHVAPNGKPGAAGSQADPWDLRTALNQPAAVKPGDTIWLHGGVYAGLFVCRLNGTADAPIILRQFPGERAILDGNRSIKGGPSANVLNVAGSYTWLWGFEVTSSFPKRHYDRTDYSDLELPSTMDVGNNVAQPGIKFINLILHDTTQGPGVWRYATDNEMYGCLVFNNGYDAPDRGHGHGAYVQNEKGKRLIVDNIFFNQFSHGIHGYGSERAPLKGFHIEGNILFNNGAASAKDLYSCNLRIGGGQVSQSAEIVENCSYFAPSTTIQGQGVACDLESGEGANAAVVKDNIFATPGSAFRLKDLGGAIVAGNTFYGAVQGFDPAAFPQNAYCGQVRPSGVKVLVRPNKYEPGRAHLCVFNWDNLDTVQADVSKVLAKGDRYEVRDAQNYFGLPVAEGVYNSAPVTLPLNSTEIASPTGEPPRKLVHTPKEFNAFVLIKK